MSDTNCIQVLPEVVANQIAAGEVVQRPASVVKELLENSIDAGSTQIDIYIKDAGRTLIQVIDNGIGMSENDAVTAFLPHATSKIRQADDLFALFTMGFRGEALASIAAVAHVELRTKRKQDELGSCVCLSGGHLESQELVSCANGTNIAVRDLFYNIPARRKFLKSNESEFRNIVSVVEQITLAHPTLEFSLYHNGQVIFKLLPENTHKRILSIIGKKMDGKLLPIQVETILGTISGYIGTPEAAVKRGASQFFFVNHRYIQHPYFNKAVQMGYEKLISTDAKAPYFIYFDVEPAKIDVNIHPTKTEVRFEDEKAFFPILSAIVRETLGKANAVPTIDFDQDDAPFIPAAPANNNAYAAPLPKVSFDPSYNPFKGNYTSKNSAQNWESLYDNSEPARTSGKASDISILQESSATATNWFEPLLCEQPVVFKAMQWKRKYIVWLQESGMQVLHQHRLHSRILYEQYLKRMKQGQAFSLPLLFPEILELSAKEHALFVEVEPHLKGIGFEFEPFGKTTYQITAVPDGLGDANPVQTVLETMQLLQNNTSAATESKRELVAKAMAEKTAIVAGKELSDMQIKLMLEQLSACQDTTYSPNGLPIAVTIDEKEIENKLK